MNQSLLQSAWRAHQSGQLQDAARLYAEVLRTNPGDVDALYLFAQLHFQTGHFAEAERLTGDAARRNPNAPPIWFLRGCALQQLGRHDDAITAFGRALALQPRFTEVLVNRGGSLLASKRHEAALADFDAALALNPNMAQAWNNRGNALSELGRHAEAAESYARVLALYPDLPQALVNRGTALLALGRSTEARASYDEALRAEPANADALCGRANAAYELKDFEAAATDYASVLVRNPDHTQARGNLLSARLQICDWRDLREETARVEADVLAGKPALTPIQFLALSDSPEAQLRCASAWTAAKHPSALQPLWRGEYYRHDRIRVAYLSEDFRDHAVALLMAGVWERHDRTKFEIFAFSFGPDDGSRMRKRIGAACEHFIDVREKNDGAIARAVRDSEIDIAVDLMGYSGHNRTGIFALRPAPVQVNFLGYPGTMGAPYMDYIVADRTVIPEDARRHYSERVAYLPDCLMPADAARVIGETPTRRGAGLPDNAFVFCSFNNSSKLSPDGFAVWMRLLTAVPDSVLWLPESNAAAMRNLRSEARTRGIDPTRLVFAPFAAKQEDHLARLKLADLFLDTLPYNAHATASDALWAGLPVLTCMGNGFAARVAASLLRAAGLPELVTASLAEYEGVALKLAREPETLRGLRERLVRAPATQKLFDTEGFTRNLEILYTDMRDGTLRQTTP